MTGRESFANLPELTRVSVAMGGKLVVVRAARRLKANGQHPTLPGIAGVLSHVGQN
jgi:hypothetical protein